MADANRTSTDSLAALEPLLQAPYRFDFFYAMRLLECVFAEHPRLGCATTPENEPVRLGQDCSLAFPPAALTSSVWQPQHQSLRLGVAFLGLFGPQGPLPLHLTEYALERIRHDKDHTFVGFADWFHHRLLCLFYRAWANAQPAVSLDRSKQDGFGLKVASLCGLGLTSLQHRDAMADHAKLHFCGHLASLTKHPDGLAAMIGSYFQVPVRISEFVGEWLEIADRDRCLLGVTPATGRLGATAIVGAYAFECQHKFRIHIGPLTRQRYADLLPSGDVLPALIAVVRNYLGDTLAWDLQLILHADEVPPLRPGTQVQLGWTSWLGAREQVQDAGDLLLDPIAQVATTARNPSNH